MAAERRVAGSPMVGAIACRICKATHFEPRFRKDGFALERCLQCGLTQIASLPEGFQIESLYDEQFFQKHYRTLQENPRNSLKQVARQGHHRGKRR